MVLIIIQAHLIRLFSSPPWLLGLLGFPLTLQLQAKTKKTKIKINLGSPNLEPTTMPMPNQRSTIHPIDISC